MTPAQYLAKYPNARPSTIAFLIKRDEVVRQLRKETANARGWQSPKWWRALADVLRGRKEV